MSKKMGIIKKGKDVIVEKADTLVADEDIRELEPLPRKRGISKHKPSEGSDKISLFARLGKTAIEESSKVTQEAMKDDNPAPQKAMDMKKSLQEAILEEFKKPGLTFEQKQYYLEKLNELQGKADQYAAYDVDKHLEHKEKIFEGFLFGVTGGAYAIAKPIMDRKKKKKDKEGKEATEEK